jgi:hypothetical protein
MIPKRRNITLQNPNVQNPEFPKTEWFLSNWMISQTKRASSCVLHMNCPQIHHSITMGAAITIGFSRKWNERARVCFYFLGKIEQLYTLETMVVSKRRRWVPNG